jgi:hypothetical protein
MRSNASRRRQASPGREAESGTKTKKPERGFDTAEAESDLVLGGAKARGRLDLLASGGQDKRELGIARLLRKTGQSRKHVDRIGPDLLGLEAVRNMPDGIHFFIRQLAALDQFDLAYVRNQ